MWMSRWCVCRGHAARWRCSVVRSFHHHPEDVHHPAVQASHPTLADLWRPAASVVGSSVSNRSLKPALVICFGSNTEETSSPGWSCGVPAHICLCSTEKPTDLCREAAHSALHGCYFSSPADSIIPTFLIPYSPSILPPASWSGGAVLQDVSAHLPPPSPHLLQCNQSHHTFTNVPVVFISWQKQS